MTQGFRIALIGGGNMGGALAAGWLRTKRGGITADDLVVIDPNPGDVVQDLVAQSGITVLPELTAEAAAGLDLVVFAVKPQVFEQACAVIADRLPAAPRLLSLLPGFPLPPLSLPLSLPPLPPPLPPPPP
uniref:pyrroline-5-carboxylate reductase family protein n=1 Tax=uncultured Maricaulis sp. TaxID=174710 RepID=UPI0030DCE53D